MQGRNAGWRCDTEHYASAILASSLYLTLLQTIICYLTFKTRRVLSEKNELSKSNHGRKTQSVLSKCTECTVKTYSQMK